MISSSPLHFTSLLHLATFAFRLLLVGLLAYRAARLVTKDDGPWDVMRWFRVKMGCYNLVGDPLTDGGMGVRPSSNLGRFFSCSFCVGIVLTPILIFVFKAQHPQLDWVLVAGAVTGLQSYMHEAR